MWRNYTQPLSSIHDLPVVGWGCQCRLLKNNHETHTPLRFGKSSPPHQFTTSNLMEISTAGFLPKPGARFSCNTLQMLQVGHPAIRFFGVKYSNGFWSIIVKWVHWKPSITTLEAPAWEKNVLSTPHISFTKLHKSSHCSRWFHQFPGNHRGLTHWSSEGLGGTRAVGAGAASAFTAWKWDPLLLSHKEMCFLFPEVVWKRCCKENSYFYFSFCQLETHLQVVHFPLPCFFNREESEHFEEIDHLVTVDDTITPLNLGVAIDHSHSLKASISPTAFMRFLVCQQIAFHIIKFLVGGSAHLKISFKLNHFHEYG